MSLKENSHRTRGVLLHGRCLRHRPFRCRRHRYYCEWQRRRPTASGGWKFVRLPAAVGRKPWETLGAPELWPCLTGFIQRYAPERMNRALDCPEALQQSMDGVVSDDRSQSAIHKFNSTTLILPTTSLIHVFHSGTQSQGP